LIFNPLEIKKIRKDNGLTQKKFAESLDVNITSVQKWESGARNPSKEMWFFITTLYNVETTRSEEIKEKINFKSYKIDEKLNVMFETLESLVEHTKDLREQVNKNEKVMIRTNRNQAEHNFESHKVLEEIKKNKSVRKLTK